MQSSPISSRLLDIKPLSRGVAQNAWCRWPCTATTSTTGIRQGRLLAVGDRLCRVKEDAIMLVVHVHVHVKSERVEAFRQATLDNARNSINEPGIIRFDVIQQNDDPTRFVLIEIYRAADDPARHKQTAHYQTWRDTVAEMMAEPRSSVKYANVFPADAGWEMPDGKTTTGKTISSTKGTTPTANRGTCPSCPSTGGMDGRFSRRTSSRQLQRKKHHGMVVAV